MTRFLTVLCASVLSFNPTLADPPSGDKLKEFLSHPILDPNQTLNELIGLCRDKIPRMPEVQNVMDWEREAARIRKEFLDKIIYRGRAAQWREAETRVEWKEIIQGGPEYRIRKLRFEALPEMWIPALLYEPLDLVDAPGTVKRPVMLAVNGHTSTGKATPYKQIRCINLAKRGMIVLNVEWLGMGQLRSDGYTHYKMNQLDLCGASGLAPFYLNMKRGLDVLLAHPNADQGRVAVSGLSGGGWQTIFLSALDTRVTLSNPVAGYSGFRTRLRHFKDLGDSEQTPIDMATVGDYTHLTALVAPRPALLTYNATDGCCFEAGYALPPLLQAARPIYELHNKRANLRSHINHDPGDHNFERDNREALYRMIGDHFYPGEKSFNNTEFPCEDEVKSIDELKVELPPGNLDFNSLARGLSRDLPRKSAQLGDLNQQLSQLKEIIAFTDYEIGATLVESQKVEDYVVKHWKLHLGGEWTVPLVEISPPKPGRTVLHVSDKGRARAEDSCKKLLAEGNRVLLIDPFMLGESHLGERHFLWALMAGTIGDRPLGIQAGQIAATARWAAKRHELANVDIQCDGPRISVAAQVAGIAAHDVINNLVINNGLPSLQSLIDQNVGVDKMPELFPFGLLEYFDVPQLRELFAECKRMSKE